MPSSTSPTILGLDVHKNTISAAILRPGEDVADVEKISSDDDAVRRPVARVGNPRRLRAVTRPVRPVTSWPDSSKVSESAVR
jgi:hypothetical protein